jgi:hypothetical protein
MLSRIFVDVKIRATVRRAGLLGVVLEGLDTNWVSRGRVIDGGTDVCWNG